MNSAPVSVIVPAYNSAETIESSLRSALEQTLPPAEIVVVDDGSSDGTAERVHALGDERIKLHRQENAGSASARNHAIREASHDWLAFLDADDLWLPEKLASQMAVVEAHPGVTFLFANVVNTDLEGRILGSPFIDLAETEMPDVPHHTSGDTLIFEKPLLPYFLLDNHAHTQTVMVKKQNVDAVDGFNESLRVGQDIDLWFRLLKTARATYTDRVLCHRRLHEHNITADSLRPDRAQIAILTPYLDTSVPGQTEEQRQQLRLRLANLNRSVGTRLFRRGQRRDARAHLKASLALRFRIKVFLLWAVARGLPSSSACSQC